MSSTRFVVHVVLGAALLFAGVTNRGEGQEPMRLKFVAGATHYVEQKTTVDMDWGKDGAVTNVTRMNSKLEILSVDEMGNAEVAWTLQRVRASFEYDQPGKDKRTITYDSKSDTLKSILFRPMAETVVLFFSMLGEAQRFKLSEAGHVSGFQLSLVPSEREGLNKSPETKKQIETLQSDSIAAWFVFLPAEPVAKGDTWKRTISVQDPITSARVENTVVVEYQDRNEKGIVELTYSVEAGMPEDLAAVVEIKSYDMSGTVTLDSRRGWPIEIVQKTSADAVLQPRTKAVPVKMKQDNVMTFSPDEPANTDEDEEKTEEKIEE